MIVFNKISARYGGREVLHDVSFPLAPHKITAVIGKNGCGKSTLVSCVTNLVRYTGEIIYGERNVSLMTPRERAQLIAVLPQVLPKVSLTVEELVSMGRNPYLSLGRRLTEADKSRIDDAVETVGLTEMRCKPLDALSGGERQKAYVAMILAQNTRVVILDEPTTYMDMENEANFVSLIGELKKKHKKTLMIVMHDLTRAVEIADNILVLDGGKAEFFGGCGDCIENGVIERVFGVKRSSYSKDGAQKVMYYR